MVWFKKKLRPKFLARPDKLAWPPGQATEASNPSAPVGSSAAAGRGAALPRLALSSPAARSPLPGCSLSAPRLLALRSPARSPLPGSPLSARSPLPCSLSAPLLALHATQARRARAVTYVAAALRRWAGTVRLRCCAAARQDQRAHLEPSIRTLPSIKMESQSTEVDSARTRIRWIREEQSGRFPEKVTCIFVLAVCNVFIQ